jgi:hypothetical protein
MSGPKAHTREPGIIKYIMFASRSMLYLGMLDSNAMKRLLN